MSGVNSIAGLNKVNVDYRPEVDPAGNRQAPNVIEEVGAQPVRPPEGAARSVVQQLDVLLLNAARRSVAADAEQNVIADRDAIIGAGASEDEVDAIEELARKATEKLRALDNYTGNQIADALEKQQDWLVRSENQGSKAALDALDAQRELSDKLYKLNGKLARKGADGNLLDRLFELQFQCDRRETEINSIIIRMHELKQSVGKGSDTDPRSRELLGAKFSDLIPREALLMHGTADALEMMKAHFGDNVASLARKLDDFAANGGENLTKADLDELKECIRDMKTAVQDVRKNGIEVGGLKDGEKAGRIIVDRTVLDEMDGVLGEVSAKFADASRHYVESVRKAFVEEVRQSLLPDPPNPAKDFDNVFRSYRNGVEEFARTLNQLANEELTDAALDAAIADLDWSIQVHQVYDGDDLAGLLVQNGYSADVAAKAGRCYADVRLIVAQFKEMVASTNRYLLGGEAGLSAGDVRRMFLGDVGVSSVVEARVRGFNAGDASGAADDANVAESTLLGRGAAGSAYLLTMKDGSELVFKPELEGRLGLGLQAAGHGAYAQSQKIANLNLATYDTARALGCQDVVVKYSVGSHKGRFGMFMEKAPGVSAAKFAKGKVEAKDAGERSRIKGQVARKLNRLQWLDAITGQGDRSGSNYFLHVDQGSHEVTVKGIDNDASFVSNRIGMQKYKFSEQAAQDFLGYLQIVCSAAHGGDEEGTELMRCTGSEAIVSDEEAKTLVVDLSKVGTSREIELALAMTVGAQSTALPDVIDRDLYNRLMELDSNENAKADYLASIRPRLSDEGFEAAKLRLEDAIRHARELNDQGKVVGGDGWEAIASAGRPDGAGEQLKVVNSSGKEVAVTAEMFDDQGAQVKRLAQDGIRGAETSYYLRDGLDRLLD